MIVPMELLDSARALPAAQRALDGIEVLERLELAVGWHGSARHAETGAVCLVRAGGPYERLLGEVLEVRRGARRVVVWCIDAADIVDDLSLTRRAFLAVAPLALATGPMAVGVMA